ncbi:MAG: hypothetical protein FWC50_06200 [Planctomycetaceae bacterium]|nr:hypothetical protein [Planctomycetaceae bacterium]
MTPVKKVKVSKKNTGIESLAYARGEKQWLYYNPLKFPVSASVYPLGKRTPESHHLAFSTGFGISRRDCHVFLTNRSLARAWTQNGEKFLKLNTEALQRRAVAQGRRLPSIPTAV